MKHIHAELIKAWADGAKIEARYLKASGWSDWRLEDGGFIWYDIGAEYRIKPEPKPDVVGFIEVNFNFDNRILYTKQKFIIDGETGKLKSSEVIKSAEVIK
jgi:hypothetical protein